MQNENFIFVILRRIRQIQINLRGFLWKYGELNVNRITLMEDHLFVITLDCPTT